MFKINFRHRPKLKPVSRPGRLWRSFISVFLLLVAGSFVSGYWSYRQLAEIEMISQRRLESQNLEPLRLDLEALLKVRAHLDAKAARTEELKLKPSTITDPSL